MKYLGTEPIIFGSTGNKEYEEAWERIHATEVRREEDAAESK